MTMTNAIDETFRMFGPDFERRNRTLRFIDSASIQCRRIGFAFAVMCSFVGSAANLFLIFTHRRRIKNSLLGAIGVSDLLITMIVLPISSKLYFMLDVCHLMQLLLKITSYSNSHLFALLAVSEYYRIKKSLVFNWSITFACKCSALVLGAFFAGIGVVNDLDFDFCLKQRYGVFYYRAISTFIVHGSLTIVTAYYLYLTYAYDARRRCIRNYIICKANLFTFSLFITSWIPFLVLSYIYPDADADYYYFSAWITIGRSVISNFAYLVADKKIKRALHTDIRFCPCGWAVEGAGHVRQGPAAIRDSEL